MKKIFLLSVVTAVFVFSSGFISVDVKPDTNQPGTSFVNDFAFFRAHRQGTGITLSWGMVSSTNLSGFDIEKTMQDPNDPYSVWEPVASPQGTGARSYKYRDSNVLPGTTNYRITAWFSDGRSSQSEIVSIRIVSH